MALSIYSSPLKTQVITHQRKSAIRFLIPTTTKNLLPKSWIIKTYRQPNLHNSDSHYLLSISSGPSFLHLPLRSVRGFHSPAIRYHPFSMTTPLQAAADSSQTSPSKTVRVVVKGRVQGVFYRNWTIENANQLGLKGWVRNRRDGSVEALFSGNHEVVQEMEQRCRRGPPDAMVTGLQIFPSSDDPGTTFERKQTV